MRCGDVDDVDVGIFDEFGVGAIGLCFRGGFDVFEELFSSRGGRRGCCCYDGVMDVVDIAGSRVGEEIFGECLGNSSCC